MSYVDENLLPNELVRYRTQIHWSLYIPHIVLSILTLGLSLPFLLIPWYKRRTTQLAVTNRRVILVSGGLRKETTEIQLGKIETIEVDRDILESLFGSGSIRIIGTGGTNKYYKNIENPVEFKRAIQESQENNN